MDDDGPFNTLEMVRKSPAGCLFAGLVLSLGTIWCMYQYRRLRMTEDDDRMLNQSLAKWKSKKNIWGRYVMPHPNGKFASLLQIIKWFLNGFKDNSNVPSQQSILDDTLPIVKPDFKTAPSGVAVTWIGHATVLVQMDGISILTDPIFSSRASPWHCIGPRRYRDAPCAVTDLPPIDAVVISHNHYDHLDLNTVRQLNAHGNPDHVIHWLVPKGTRSFMMSEGCQRVTELDWWEEASPLQNHNSVKFIFTPSQHWCGRIGADKNKVLWGSWCVKSRAHSFFFAGDTGYNEVFKVIGETHGPFDLAAIPIGAYEPRDFMKYQHVNPSEAVQIHQDVKAKRSIGIHWGTFKLTNEYYLEPPKKTEEEMEKQDLPKENFFVLNHGETRHIDVQAGGDGEGEGRPKGKVAGDDQGEGHSAEKAGGDNQGEGHSTGNVAGDDQGEGRSTGKVAGDDQGDSHSEFKAGGKKLT